MAIGWLSAQVGNSEAPWIEHTLSALGFVALGILSYSVIKLLMGLFDLALGKRRES